MTVPAWMGTLVLALLFGGALTFTVLHHILYARGQRSREFFSFLETSGWLILTLAAGTGLIRAGSWMLTVVTGTVGLLCVITGSLLRSPNRG